jgi:hypothetical protein
VFEETKEVVWIKNSIIKLGVVYSIIDLIACCDVPWSHKLNKQDGIEQTRSRSHNECLVQIFMLYDIQLRGILRLSRL